MLQEIGVKNSTKVTEKAYEDSCPPTDKQLLQINQRVPRLKRKFGSRNVWVRVQMLSQQLSSVLLLNYIV